MKDLIKRTEKLESLAKKPQPVMTARSNEHPQEALGKYAAEWGFKPEQTIQTVRAAQWGAKDLLMRLESLESKGSAPSYLVDLLRQKMAENNVNEELPKHIQSDDALQRLIAFMPN